MLCELQLLATTAKLHTYACTCMHNSTFFRLVLILVPLLAITYFVLCVFTNFFVFLIFITSNKQLIFYIFSLLKYMKYFYSKHNYTRTWHCSPAQHNNKTYDTHTHTTLQAVNILADAANCPVILNFNTANVVVFANETNCSIICRLLLLVGRLYGSKYFNSQQRLLGACLCWLLLFLRRLSAARWV